ncbi:acyltransferase [Kiritimatiella glycovorans]|uniref:Galactoside O-acetyltransferase n=1 Tax=Kiritimatiella glycovorans TaxID=1307763 RepID=A0A0G3EET3_9BACT|nr:acyltransferase [Kiritimatiella glycovorans]AKJ63902.1 Galactoside O-acetyltransferase [Kiritimatiella glycovorans]
MTAAAERIRALMRLARDGGKVYAWVSYGAGLTLPRTMEGPGPVACVRGLPRARIEAGRGRVRLGHVALYPGVRLTCLGEGTLTMGDGGYINRFTRLETGTSIRIGGECMISWHVIISDCVNVPAAGDGDTRREPVRIGDRCWIGARAVIRGGTDLGDDCIVGAGTIVQGTYPPGAVIVGRAAEARAA